MAKVAKGGGLDFTVVCGHDNPEAVRELFTKIGDKWNTFLLLSLSQVPGCRARFSELERAIPDISQRMLTLTLRNLERDGLITREVFAEVPPRVEYELATLGRSLLEQLRGLVGWVSGNWNEVKQAQSRFDAE